MTTGKFQRLPHFKMSNILLVLGLTFMSLSTINANVIGFDFGSTFFKITLVKPGQPFAIVENTATKRKTESMISLTPDERIFGADSFIEQSKYPKETYSHLQRFLGQDWNEEFLQNMRKQRFFANEFIQDDRGLIGWKLVRKYENGTLEDKIIYTEELIAQLLKYGRKMSETQAGATIKDCVITIPSYYTPSQRRMILDAADIAGLSVLQLIHENTAAATMFGIDRLDTEKPVTVLFYNMGGMDTEVSLVRYSVITDTKMNKTYEHVEILAEAYDNELGGSDFDLVLVNIIADRFNALKERQGKADVRENPKAMRRLLKEVVKIKDILSANKLNVVKLVELQDYVSLQTTIERREFEEAAEHLFKKVMKPIDEVLAKAEISIDDVDMIELLGGGIRVPKVQEILQQELKKNELGVHLNGDEAMCFGAAFIASNSSASFKVRKVFLTQHPQSQYSLKISPVDLSKLAGQDKQTTQDQVEEEQEQNDSENSNNATTEAKQVIAYEKNYVLYKKSDFLGQKKSLSLTYDTDMQVDLFSQDTLTGVETPLASYTIKGIDKVAESEVAKREGSSQPKVTLSFELNRSGLLQLNKAEVKIEETYTVEEKLPKAKPKKSTKETEQAENNSTETESNSTSTEEAPAQEEPQVIKKTKKRPHSFPLTDIERVYHGMKSMTKEQLQESKDRLKWFEKRDEERMKKDKAKNDFEAVIYALRDWVNEDENVPFVGAGEKVEKVLEELREAENWLEDDGYDSTYAEYNKRYQALNKQFVSFKLRKEENSKRDSVVADAQKKVEKYNDKLEGLAKSKPWITEEQKKDLVERISEFNQWLEEVLQKQSETPVDADPAFLSSDVEFRLKRISSTFDRLNSIPKPKEEKPKKKKLPKNIKIDNMTFDGNEGANWEDFVKVVGDEEEDVQQQNEETVQNQQDQEQQQRTSQEEQYDASEEDL